MQRSAKFYRRNESETMKKYGLNPTKNSGSGWVEKEDGENEKIIAQLKSTDKDSIKINLVDLKKLVYHSNTSHKIPLFIIQFLGSNEEYFLIRPDDATRLSKVLQSEKGKVIKIIDKTPYKASQTHYSEVSKTNKEKIKSGSKNSRKKFYDEREKKWKK